MASILARAVAELKSRTEQWAQRLQVEDTALEMGLEWSNTKLALPRAVLCFVRQILMGNLSLEAVADFYHRRFTSEALCIARQRIPLQLLQRLSANLCRCAANALKARGSRALERHRVWMIDCTGIAMPETAMLRRIFGLPQNQKAGCGWPMAHLLLLFEQASGLVVDCVIDAHFSGDVTLAKQVHHHIQAGDIVLADSAFESYFHIAQIVQRGGHVLFPVHCGRRVDFTSGRPHSGKARPSSRFVRQLGRFEQLVEYQRPRYLSYSMSRAQHRQLPAKLMVREIQRQVQRKGFRAVVVTLVTTLLDPQQYPADELVALMEQRWRVEVNIRFLKTTMRMESLRSKSKEMIHKEIWMFLLVYNMARLVMLDASRQQDLPVERISFSSALNYLRYGDVDAPVPPLKVLPERPGRQEPRVTKQRPKTFKRMTKPRAVLRKQMQQIAESPF